MSTPQLDKTYSPHAVEDRWYQRWIDAGLFHADTTHSAQPYSMVIPPPNVTGSLHVGHALNNTLQDILIRWRRMQGRNVLWMPGTDHAGIATQNVVERQLQTEGTTREALGREEFLKRVWQWKEKSGGTIISQLKRLGASCDWERERFTMDEGLSEAVREVFVRLHADGLLYRGERLINWCPRCLTALSDIEVEHEEITGKLYTIRYALVDDPTQVLFVATTRPETLFGDTAVAVHPEDERYRHLIGKQIQLPLTIRAIPIVGDSILVDREFGTGAVKITPAHDFNDFEAGERHGLRRIKILDIHANLRLEGALAEAEVAQAVEGLPVAKARPKIEQLLTDRGLLEKSEPHKMALGKCYRCKTVVEPLLSDQWFVKIKPLAEPAIQAVEDGRVRIIPEAWKNNYLGWMRDIKDWCVSRQIWWGHQIPAWYCETCYGSPFLRRSSDGAPLIPSDATVIVAKTKPATCPKGHPDALVQDPDVLDTWFSSALWPFSTLGWPKHTPELKTFYPTSTLVTGLDILFFWVARMIMMGQHFTGQVPFRDVYIHALVRDEEGRKFSKSKGIGIDPMDVIAAYGADAMRYTLTSLAAQGRDIRFGMNVMEGGRTFVTKLWNAARFSLMNLQDYDGQVPADSSSLYDRWIRWRMDVAIAEAHGAIDEFRFNDAAQALYHFVWGELCDWYIELAKLAFQGTDPEARRAAQQSIVQVLRGALTALHPIMPFVTEEIAASLPGADGRFLMQGSYPSPGPPLAAEDAREMETLVEIVTRIRQVRGEFELPPATQMRVVFPSAAAGFVARHEAAVRALARTAPLACSDDPPSPTASVVRVQGWSLCIELDDPALLADEVRRLEKEAARIEKDLGITARKLDNPSFIERAKPEVVQGEREKLVRLGEEAKTLAERIERLRRAAGAGA